MKLVITGPLGHIGSRLIAELPAGAYDEVVLLDNLSTQRYPVLFHLRRDIPFRFYEEDILTADLPRYFKGAHTVVHLAAITDAESSVAIRDQVELTNYRGTERVARACAAEGARMIFLSTTSVYGISDGEVDEGCPKELLKPQSPYAESKLKAEEMLKEVGTTEELRFVTFRFGTIFGVSTGMRFHTAVNKFIWQACTARPLTVWTAALHQRRPYLDLSDAVSALQFGINRDLFDGRTYNAVTVNATVGDIVEVIRTHVPDLTVQFVDSRIMNQLSYTVSSARIRNAGFQFTGDLNKGVAQTIELLRGVRRW